MIRLFQRLLLFSGLQKKRLIRSFLAYLVSSFFEMIPIMAILTVLTGILKQLSGDVMPESTIWISLGIMIVSIVGRIVFVNLSANARTLGSFAFGSEKRMEIGERLLVIPEWEQENVKGQAKYAGKVPLILEPGLTFGTGSHATTRLCLMALEKHITGGQTVLDLGCGSGILSIAALRLGAESAFACDIDEKCVDVAYENAALNGIGKDRYTVLVGDVLSNGALRETLGGGYDVVVANIVADVIIGLAPMVRQFLKPGGLFLCSGIIDTRAGEVADALRQNGWEIETTRSGEGWYSYACR